MVGPSPYLPNSVIIMAIGQFFNGAFANFFLITTLPVMINDAVEGFPHNKIEVTDKSSGVVSSMFCLGQGLGPIYGSNMVNLIGFRWWADSIAFMLLAYSMVYLIIFKLFGSTKIDNNSSLDKSIANNFEIIVANTTLKDQAQVQDLPK